MSLNDHLSLHPNKPLLHRNISTLRCSSCCKWVLPSLDTMPSVKCLILVVSEHRVGMSCSEEWFPCGHFIIRAWVMASCRDGCLSCRFFYPHTQRTSGFWILCLFPEWCSWSGWLGWSSWISLSAPELVWCLDSSAHGSLDEQVVPLSKMEIQKHACLMRRWRCSSSEAIFPQGWRSVEPLWSAPRGCSETSLTLKRKQHIAALQVHSAPRVCVAFKLLSGRWISTKAWEKCHG